MAKHPPNWMVTKAWLSTIPGITASMVDTQLPTDTALWAATGFVQIGPEFGGSPGTYIPRRTPVMELHLWGVNPGNSNPNWQVAEDLGELIAMTGAFGNHHLNTALVMPKPDYKRARVTGVKVVNWPHRALDDVANYAHVELDLELHWIHIED